MMKMSPKRTWKAIQLHDKAGRNHTESGRPHREPTCRIPAEMREAHTEKNQKNYKNTYKTSSRFTHLPFSFSAFVA
jgi:hypothetical protein